MAPEAHAIVRTGKALLSAGAETYRVRLAMGQVAAALGVEWLQSHVTLTEVTVTLFRGAEFRTQVGQVHSVSVNADKLTRLEALAGRLGPGATPMDVERELDGIDHLKRIYPPWLNALATALACTAVGYLNNAWAVELFGVFVGAFLGQFLRALLGKRHVNVYLQALAGGLVAAFCYIGVTALLSLATGDTTPHSAGYVPALIFLVPGYPLVTALFDLVKTDMTAGLSRLAHAFMILAAAAGALLVVTWVIDVTPDPLPPHALPVLLGWVLAAVASGVGVAGWAVMFNTPIRGALCAGAVGIVANLVKLGLVRAGAPVWAASAAGALALGLLAYVIAWRTTLAEVTLAVPAAIILVPGAYAFRALVFLSSGAQAQVFQNAFQAVLTIAGMAIGLSLARIATDRSWGTDQRRPLGA
ncbi:MAG: threonine/serine exporter family protein [Bifidobacteriaceae bacterium]|jgi:uncharacterized membrane protein YjjP (DUF1212 family)|nr:threonine/serine exporter family protein [Bifidobacteriaceae bacterium]